jgi:sugar lactone lactonase YvrE
VAPDQRFVLVNETGAYRIRRFWLKGPRAGQNDIFIDNLPAFPDGVSQGSDSIFWVAMASPRKASVDNLMPRPFLRKVITRLPDFLQPAPTRFGFVLGLDMQGRVIYNLQDPSGKFTPITSVQEWNGNLFLGSLGSNGVGVYKFK